MYYRYDADDLMYEVLDNGDNLICKTNTEEEAKKIIQKML